MSEKVINATRLAEQVIENCWICYKEMSSQYFGFRSPSPNYVQIRSYAVAPMVPKPKSCPIRPRYVRTSFRPGEEKVSNATLHSSAA